MIMQEDLNDYKKNLEGGLKVPEGYFKDNKKVLLSIPLLENEKNTEKKTISLWPKVLAWSLSAAAIISMALFFLNPEPQNIDPWDGIEASLNEMDSEHIEDYLMNEYIYGADESLLLNEVEFEDI